MPEHAVTARPRLRGDVHLVPAPDGARMVTNRGTESFTGGSIHQWLSRLAPYLTGTATVGELTGALPPDKAGQVRRIVAALAERGLARDGGPAPDGPHRGELGLLDSFHHDATAAFRRYQATRVQLVGVGPLAAELHRVLRDSGLDRVTAVRPGEGRARGGLLDGDLLDGNLLDPRAGLVVSVTDHPGNALAVDRACRAAGVPVLHAVRHGDELWVGVSGGAASWECGWRRLAGWDVGAAPLEPADEPRIGAGVAGVSNAGVAAFGDSTVAVAASLAGMLVLRHVTSAVDGLDHTLTCLHLPSLRCTTHRYLPHFVSSTAPTPRVAVRGAAGGVAGGVADPPAVAERLAALRAGEPVDREGLDAAGAAMLDARLGVLGEVSERGYAQLPLNVSAATVSAPPRLVTGAGLTVREARWRAVLAGVAAYSATAVDPARLDAAGRVCGYRLADGRPVPVDAGVAFDPAAPGVVAGYDWAGAVSAGLLACCARLTAGSAAAQPARPQTPGTQTPGPGPQFLDPRFLDPRYLDLRTVEVLAADAGEEALAYLRMLEILSVPLAVHDVTGVLQVPTLAFGVGDRTIGYVSGLRAADTLTAGLRAVLLHEQSRRHGQPDYAPPEVPQLPPHAGATGGAAEPPAARTEEQVVAALVAHGHDPVAVPLDHDPQVHRILPYAVNVVISHS